MKKISALLAFCLLFTGCAQSMFMQPTPAPFGENAVSAAPPAPEGDLNMSQTFKAIVYYWSTDEDRMEPAARDITVAEGRTRAEALINEMLRRPDEEGLRHLRSVFPEGTELISLENSNGVATVTFSAQFQQINEPERQFMVHTAITNTLTENMNISSVVILGDGRESGIRDIPFGAWERKSSNYTADWSVLSNELEQIYMFGNEGGGMSLKRNAVLYFTSKSGEYLVPEMRADLDFRASPESYVQTLLHELIRGPSDTENMRSALPAELFPEQAPKIEQGEEGRILTVYLPENFYVHIEDNEYAMRRAFGSIVLTMCGFVPGLESVRFMEGDTLITRVNDLEFEEGRMRRADYTGLVGRDITLYAPNVNRDYLTQFTRAVGQQASWRPRTVLRELVQLAAQDNGPQRIFPHGTALEDILGLAIVDDLALVNLSAQMETLCQGISASDERLMIYSIVNSLTELPGVNRVRFFVSGQEVDFLGGHVYLRGDFLRNTGMVK